MGPWDEEWEEESVAAARRQAAAAHARATAAQAAAHAHPGDGLTIRTTAGWVHGKREHDDDRLDVSSWKGIPFGKDTARTGRFCAPEPVEAWEGVRECRHFGQVAPQPTYSWTERVIGSEDCLNLDVVRPTGTQRLPVVVYLHGGSFIMGSSHMLMLRGFHLAQSMNVVYVSINFRLGALGYLDLRSLPGECVANPAVLDQLLALEWVRDNIAQFGGDPDNITLMGESAGAAAVLSLMTSPAAQGLFHKAIAQSPPIGLIHSRAQSTLWARELIKRLALTRGSGIEELRAEEWPDLVRAGQSMMWRAGELLHLNSCYAPTLDDDVLPMHPLEAFEKGTQAGVPLLVGTNSGETSFAKYLFQREDSRARAGLRLLRSFDEHNAEQVVDAYGRAEGRRDFADLLSDALFWAPTVRAAGAHAQRYPTWMYRFDYTPMALRWLGLGAVHSLELANVFGDPNSSRMSLVTKLGNGDAGESMTQLMQEHWARFIWESEPAPSWPRYRVDGGEESELRATQVFDIPPRVDHDPKAEQRRAWEDYSMLEWGAGRPELLAELGFITSEPD